MEKKGRKGERATMRAGGHETSVMTVGMSLTASASSPLAELHMANRELWHASCATLGLGIATVYGVTVCQNPQTNEQV